MRRTPGTVNPHSYSKLCAILILVYCLTPPSLSAQDIFVTFDNHSNGTYTEDAIVRDFGRGYLLNNPGARLSIVPNEGLENSKSLRLTFNAGEVGAANSGGQFFGLLSSREEYTLDYYVRFDEQFDFRLGGKIPGLSGGESNSGGNKPTGDGWSARYNWRENGRVVLYLYHLDQPTRYGEDLDLNRRFQPGDWHRLTQRIRLNTDDNSDGEIQVWFDGELVLVRSDIRFRSGSQAPIDHFFFSTFHGGNTEDWAPRNTGYAYFDNIRITPDASALTGLQQGNVLAVLETPSEESVFAKGATIKLRASATALSGPVEEVAFFEGDQKIGEATYPYEWFIYDAKPGTYSFSVSATAGGETSARSKPRYVTVEDENPSKGANLALGRQVQVTGEQEGNPGAAAVDGSTESEDRWSAQGFPQSLIVDLGEDRFINHVEILPFQDRAYRYTVDVSRDGQQFETVVDNSNNSTQQSIFEHAFSLVEARYVRLRVTGAFDYTGSWISIKEFRIFDTSSIKRLVGDITGDGFISALDASRLLMHILGLQTLSSELQIIADVTGNGVLNESDVELILRRVAGLITCFPVEDACRVSVASEM